jgi:hypothetical protein
MDNPEAYATLGTNDTVQRHTNKNKHRILQ